MKKLLSITILLFATSILNAQEDKLVEFRITIDPKKESEQQNLKLKKISKKICSNISDFAFGNCKQLKKSIVQKAKIKEKIVLFSSTDYWQADKFKKVMRNLEFKTAFMEAFYENKRVPFSGVMSGKYRSSLHKEEVITFKVQIDLKKEMEIKSSSKDELRNNLCNDLKKLYLEAGLKKEDAILNCASLTHQIKNSGSFGTYSFTNNNINYQVAKQLKNHLIENGYSTTKIISLKNGEVVPLKDVVDQK